VSWHLGRLRAAGLVATRRSGRETVCSLRPEAFDLQAVRERELLGLDGREADDREGPVPSATLALPAQPGTADA
jgi:DNA-binding transcriptional ArsR family regulator